MMYNSGYSHGLPGVNNTVSNVWTQIIMGRWGGGGGGSVMIIITDNFCIALFSGVPKLAALYNILQHFLSFTNIIHIIMTTNNV